MKHEVHRLLLKVIHELAAGVAGRGGEASHAALPAVLINNSHDACGQGEYNQKCVSSVPRVGLHVYVTSSVANNPK